MFYVYEWHSTYIRYYVFIKIFLFSDYGCHSTMSGCVVQGSSSSSQYLLDQVEFSWKWWLLHTTVNDFGEPAIWRPSANIVTPFAKWRWHLYHLVLHDHKYKYHGHKATVQNAEGTQWIFNYWLDEKTIDDGHPPPSLSTRQCRFWFQNKSCIQSNCHFGSISDHFMA